MTAVPHLDLTEAVLRPIRGQHAFEGCVEQLATAIRLGVYRRGTSLPPERDLADRLGVSRETLRQAIAALREARLVETRRGRGGGTFVTLRPTTPPMRRTRPVRATREQWLDDLVFRRVAEPGAAHLAATRGLSVAQVELLTNAHAAVAEASDPAQHRQADSRFHLSIAAVTGSPRIIEAVTSVQASLHDMLSAIPVLEQNITHSDRQHRSIVTAIIGGNATHARRVLENHCDDTAALLRGLLD